MKYYYADPSNNPVGPHTLEELARLSATGAIHPQTYVVEEGGSEWKAYSEVVPLIQPSPPLLAGGGLYEIWFDTEENKALLAICARKTIRNIGIGGIIWGVINVGVGIFAIQATWLNLGLVALGLLMLGTGIHALWKPSLNALLAEVIVGGLLFCWNVGIAILNTMVGAPFAPRGLIWPLIFVFIFARQYKRLLYLQERIAFLSSEEIKKANEICKTIIKKKIKAEPNLVETADKKCRFQLMEDKVFCIQRDLLKAFVIRKEEFFRLMKDINAKKISMTIKHPIDKLSYSFDKTASEKIRGWQGSVQQTQG